MPEALVRAQEELGRLMASLGEPMPEDPFWAVDRLKDLLDGAEERLARGRGGQEELAELAKMEEALGGGEEKKPSKGSLGQWISSRPSGRRSTSKKALQEAKLKQELLGLEMECWGSLGGASRPCGSCPRIEGRRRGTIPGCWT